MTIRGSVSRQSPLNRLHREGRISDKKIKVMKDPYEGKPIALREGILSDVAPTMLSVLKIKLPYEMNGRNLLSELLKTRM